MLKIYSFRSFLCIYRKSCVCHSIINLQLTKINKKGNALLRSPDVLLLYVYVILLLTLSL